MTIWNDATFADKLAHATWMANTAVLMHLNERATGDPARDWLASWAHRWFVGDNLRVLVLGCGEGWLERVVAQWPFVAQIDAVDFAKEAVARARELARGIGNIHYGVVDLNRDTLQRDAYDVVIAHSVLHHVDNLEHAYAQIESAMRANATLIVNEYIGPNRFQYSDEVLAMINALFRCLPKELRGNYESRRRPPLDEMLAYDPTEGVRAEEVVPLLERHFDVRERKQLGGAVVQHLLFDVVQHFRFENARHRSLLEMLCTIDAMLTDRGRINSDFAIFAARRKGSGVEAAPRPLPPRPVEALDVEPDPLQRIPLLSRVANGGALDAQQRRLLRLAVLSQNETRANLFAEDAAMGSFGWSDAWAWMRRCAPDDPAVRGLVETAAAILAPA
ncbi:MAG: class I SAM-dependent methyltransferase [Acidobacteriota bacterium]|nr:class I SAM-dependent methyltransferase [Acidobacteriota bacterium]